MHLPSSVALTASLSDASDGAVLWIRLDNVPVTGRLVVMQRRNGLASNYDCTYCVCPASYSGLSESPTTGAMVPGDTCQFRSTGTYQDCNNNLSYWDVTSATDWSSTNTAVCTVDNTFGSSTHGLGRAIAGGSDYICGTYSDNVYTLDVTTAQCVQTSQTFSPCAAMTVHVIASFNISVTSTPVSGETNSVLSGQAANVQVQAIDNFNAVFTQYRGTAHLSSPDSQATLPGDSSHNYTYTATDNGSHTFPVTLRSVTGTSPTQALSAQDTQNPSTLSSHNAYLWFSLSSAIQFYENCDGFTLGSYHNQTACNPNGLSQNSVFIALPDNGSVACRTSIRIRGQGNGTLVTTTFQERGPGPLGRLWWNTGSVPTDLGSMCVSDGVALALGQTFVNGGSPGANKFGCPNTIPNNPPNSAFGQANIYLRFGP